METLVADLRYAVATARRTPGFTAAAIVILALGVGATTAVFSAIDGVLLRPLPYPAADRLVRLYEEHPGAVAPLDDRRLSNLTFHAWLDRGSRTLVRMAAYHDRDYTVGFQIEGARLHGAAMTPDLFAVLRAVPAAGRFFAPEDVNAGADPTVVLSDSVWRTRFDASSDVVGRTLSIDGRSHTIVGIAPPGFYFPDRTALLWTPYLVSRPSGEGYQRKVTTVFAIGRLETGVTPAQAAAEGTAAARSTGVAPLSSELFFGRGGPPTVRADTMASEMTAGVRPVLLVMAAGVLLVLVIACANVANLLLSRGIARQRELAVRAALGASRGRLVRQLLTESALLALMGGAVGLLLAWISIAAAPAFAPPDLPRLADIRMDPRVVAFALIASVFAALAGGLLPALYASRRDLAASVHADRGTTTPFGGRDARRFRDGLLVVEAALAVLLLIGAALVTRSFVRLVHVKGGYDPTNVLTARIYLPDAAASPERAGQLLETLLGRLRAMTGVVAVGGGNMMPFGESTSLSGFDVPSRESGQRVTARTLEYAVTPGYAEALGLHLREGRTFTDRDTASALSRVLVNEEFARLYLPEGPLAGRLVPTGLGSSDKVAEIVGVVDNVLKDGLTTTPQPEIYLLLSNGMPMREINVVVRTAGDPAAIAPGLRSLVRELDRSAAIGELTPLAALVSASVGRPRFATAVLGAFAGLALLLAAVGLYGALTYTVSQRRRELGVRAALGAERSDLIRIVLGRGLAITATGLLVGLMAAFILTRLMERLLFGVTPLDPMSFLAAPALLLPVALAACLLPALRAAAADPAEVLRAE